MHHNKPVTVLLPLLKSLYKSYANETFTDVELVRRACWLLVPRFAGSNPAEAVEFFGRKNFLRRLSKAICPHVAALRHVKEPYNEVGVAL
jgi:hypothetical protein